MKYQINRDDALSPVIAFMLLLMVVVSFISILNAYYIPSLKQQNEIEHLHNVEASFLKLSPDILQVLTLRQDTSMKESVQLGGGDVIFSSLKSSGYLEINTTLQEDPISKISIQIDGDSHPEFDSTINKIRVLYRPVGNFWINQGYEWEDGLLNISKGNRNTSLQYTDDDPQAFLDMKNYYNMTLPRIHTEEYENNLTSIKIDLINIENPAGNRSFNGNGAGVISINLKESGKYVQNLTDSLVIRIDDKNKDMFDSYAVFNNTGLKKRLNKTNTVWYGDNDNQKYTLKIQDGTPIEEQPLLEITRWNLSFKCN